MKTEDKHKLVIDEWFVNGFNGAAAYRSVYPKIEYDNARIGFQQILTLPNIQEYKNSKHKAIGDAYKMSHNELFETLKSWLESDITETLELTTAEIKELPLSIRQLIQSYEHNTYTTEKGAISNTVKLKFISKEKAAEMISKHIGFYKEDNAQKNTDETDYSKLSIKERAQLLSLLAKSKVKGD